MGTGGGFRVREDEQTERAEGLDEGAIEKRIARYVLIGILVFVGLCFLKGTFYTVRAGNRVSSVTGP